MYNIISVHTWNRLNKTHAHTLWPFILDTTSKQMVFTSNLDALNGSEHMRAVPLMLNLMHYKHNFTFTLQLHFAHLLFTLVSHGWTSEVPHSDDSTSQPDRGGMVDRWDIIGKLNESTTRTNVCSVWKTCTHCNYLFVFLKVFLFYFKHSRHMSTYAADSNNRIISILYHCHFVITHLVWPIEWPL